MATQLIQEALVWLDWSGFYIANKKTSIIGWLGCFTCLILFLCQMIQFAVEITNMETIASVLEVLPSFVLALFKILTILIYAPQLDELTKACYDFWPASKISKELDTEIQSIYRTVLIMLRCYRWLAMITVTMIVPLKPFLAGKGLPVEIWQPFDLTQTPIYQITFFVQSFSSYSVTFINIGFDSLFVGIMTIIICQVQICGRAFKTLNFKDIKDKSDEDKCWENMKSYIEYHNHLIRIANKIQKTFSLIFFIMFGVSTIYVCIDLYMLASDEIFSFMRFVKYLFQCSFFVFLLFSYCFTGNQLTYQCLNMADEVYFSEWYDQPSNKIRKAIVSVIQRTQKFTKLSAGGLMDLDLVNFLKMLKLAFSFFTIIRTQTAKKQTMQSLY